MSNSKNSLPENPKKAPTPPTSATENQKTVQQQVAQSQKEDADNIAASEMDFVNDIKAAILFKKTRFAGGLILLLVAFFVTFLVWAKLAIVDEMTSGEGKVITSSQVKKIQSLEGGIILEVLVSPNQIVQKGQVLLKLDDTRFASSYRERQQKHYALLAQIARLFAESHMEKKIDFPKVLYKENPEIVKREQRLFDSRRQNLDHAINTLQQNYNLIQREINITAPLVKEGVISKIELLRLERQANEIKGDLEEKEKIFKEESQAELNRLNAELESLTESLVGEKDRITRTIIYSPVNGKIKAIHVSTIGQVVKPGEDIMEIVPLDDSLLIQARVTPRDIGFIKPDQKAVVKITAYDFSIYGGLNGIVKEISPDTIVDEKGNTFFEITVQTNKNYLGSKQSPLTISPGMTASVHVLTGKKSILDYLLKPLIKGKQNAFRER